MNGSRMMIRLALLASVLVTSLGAGTEMLLYPLARAFGGPREAELVKCREGFRQFQAGFTARPITVLPVLSRPGYSATDARSAWSAERAVALAAALHGAALPGRDPVLRIEAAVPGVPATHFGHNQMLYLWSRAGAYSRHIQTARPPGDYFLFTEIYTFGDFVGGIQVYVIDESGQLVYCRLFNSHHFGNHLSLHGAYVLIARHLFEDLGKRAEEVFPPYGVG